MILFSILLFALLVLSLIRLSAFDFFSPVAEKAHLFCLRFLPPESQALAELKALVCAENFSSLNDSQLYISSGLIHLFVVSGAHLLLIERLLNRTKCNSGIIFFILVLYAFACNLGAPVVRCLLAFGLNFFLVTKNIRWPAHFRLLLIGLATLCFNYNWINSLSLQLSWLAAFIMMLGEKFFTTSSKLFKQSLFFVTLLPTVVFFQIPSAGTILLNILLAPALEFVLFPLALCTWFFAPTYRLFDFAINLFKSVLTFLELDFQIQLEEISVRLTLYNWALLLVLHLVFHLFHVHKARNSPDEN